MSPVTITIRGYVTSRKDIISIFILVSSIARRTATTTILISLAYLSRAYAIISSLTLFVGKLTVQGFSSAGISVFRNIIISDIITFRVYILRRMLSLNTVVNAQIIC